MKNVSRAITLVVMTLADVQSARCDEHRVGGRSAGDEFSDANTASLARASCVGDEGGIKAALKLGGDPNGKGRGGETPLFWAVNCENLTGIEGLLKVGANPNYIVPRRFSATYEAATMSNAAPLKLLLKHGGDPNASSSAQTALEAALSNGLDGRGWDGYYALLDGGADINRGNEVGDTIATTAAALGAFDKVEELLRRGYDYDLVSLGASVQARQVASPTAWEARARVIELLKARGVQFPIPALLALYTGRARMENDGRLIVTWYGGLPKDGGPEIEPWHQIIEKDDTAYEEILRRVGGLKPGYGKGIPRYSDDPVPFGVKLEQDSALAVQP